MKKNQPAAGFVVGLFSCFVLSQDMLGYDTLRLNNAIPDPTFCCEVVYNNFVSQFVLPGLRR